MADNEEKHSADPGGAGASVGESSFLLRPAWASQMTDEQEKNAIFGIVGGSLFASSFLATFIIPLLPEFRYKQGLSLFETSALFASFGLGEMAGTPIAAVLGGQIRCWMLIGLSLVFLTLYGVSFMTTESDFFVMFCARLLGGIATNVLRTAGFALVEEVSLTSERLQKAVVLYFCMAFGLTMGPLLGGSLAGDDAFYSSLFGALVCVGLLGATLVFLRQSTVELPKGEPYTPHLRHPPTLLSLAAIALVGCTVSFAEILLPLHLSMTFQTTAAALGGLFMIVSISYIFMANLTAILAEKINRNFMLCVGLGGLACSIVILTVPTSLAVEVIPVLILGSSASVVCGGALLRLVDTMHGGDLQALQISQVTSLCRSTGTVFGPVLFAFLAGGLELGYDDATYFFGVLVLAAAVALGHQIRQEPIGEDDTLQVPQIADLQLQYTL